MRGSPLPLAALGLLLAGLMWWALSGTTEQQAPIAAPRADLEAQGETSAEPEPTADDPAIALAPSATTVERSEVVAKDRATDSHGLWLSARLERPDGQPLANAGVRVELLVRDGTGGEDLLLVSVYRPTNATGGMLADIRGFAIYNKKRASSAASASVVLSRNVGGSMLAATVDVDAAALVERGLDLGTVRLERAQLVVAGRVVDTLGRPLSGVAVEVRHRAPSDPSDSVGRRATLCPTSTTSATGGFAIRGSLPDPPYHLALLSGAGIQHAGREFELGATDHELVLARNGWLSLEPVDNAARSRSSRVTAVLEAAYPMAEPGDEPAHLQPGVEHRLTRKSKEWSASLPPGTYTLRVQRDVDARPIVELEHLVVPPGEACADPRLVGLDLQDYLRPLKVTAVDRLGRPIPEPGVALWDGDRFRGVEADDQGRVFVDSWPVRLQVSRYGYAPRHLLAETDVEVQLADASRRVWLVLPGSWGEGALEGAEWHARATPLDRGPGGELLATMGNGASTGWSDAGFGERITRLEQLDRDVEIPEAWLERAYDEAEQTSWIKLAIEVPGNGRYRIDLAQPQAKAAGTPDFDREPLLSLELEVQDGTSEYVLAVSDADLARATAAWTGA